MISHRSVLNHMFWMQSAFPLTEADVVLQKTPLNFDASGWEFYLPLLNGARVILARPEGQSQSDYLVQVVAEQDVTILQVVPSMLRMLLDEPRLKNCQSLRRLFSGGETLSLELQERLFASLSTDLINFYGPTEATIDATVWACQRGSDDEIVPIGHPIANTQIHILDVHRQQMPIGVAGELYIGGAGLSRGYSNRPDLTAERFIPNPFSDEPGARLLRTGDLARHRADGAIEFLGRADHQVKLRGFRIEPEEIEIVLEEHSEVRQAIVMLREFAPGDHRLVGYILPKNRAQPTTTDLRQFLAERLPATMVPSTFILLESFPLMPSGKLDRRALPMPDTKARELETVYVAPQNHIEETLASIWAEVLGREQVGIHDNFFELGGHSLLVTRVVSRIRETLHIEMPLRNLFEEPTIKGLARIAARIPSDFSGVSANAIRRTQGDTEEELSAKVDQLSDEEVDLMLQRMLAQEKAFEAPLETGFTLTTPGPSGLNTEQPSERFPPQQSGRPNNQPEQGFSSASFAPVNAQAQFEAAYINYVRARQEAWVDAQQRCSEAYVTYLKTLQQMWANVDVNTLDPNSLLAISQLMAMAALSTASSQNGLA
jgi:acyl carrier protein